MTKRTPHILVIIEHFSREANAIRHGLALAQIFHCNLAVAFKKNKENNTSEDIQDKQSQIQSLLPETKIPIHCLLMDSIEAEPNLSIQLLDAMYLVMQIDKRKGWTDNTPQALLKVMRKAKVPSIVVQKDTPIGNSYQNIFLPVGYQRVNKEKMIWGSYFGRFHNARLYLLTAKETARELILQINSILVFTKNIFKQFSFEYEILSGNNKTNRIELEAFDRASKKGGLVVIMTNNYNSWLNDLFGAPELKSILNKQKLPVMCINPNKDYYLPCS
ncbi:MAG: hypothetical protein ACEPOZ_18240 [Marinifilaceae bacterium]